MSLNPAQETAVKNCGIQLILTGRGSGKTKVITEKILHLLDQGIPSSRILALTFSEKAAAGMSERVEQQRPHLLTLSHRLLSTPSRSPSHPLTSFQQVRSGV